VALSPALPSPQPEAEATATRTGWAAFWQTFGRSPRAVAGLAIVLLLAGVAVFAPALAPHPPNLVLPNGLSLDGAPIPPEWHLPFILGTDQVGRDELARLLTFCSQTGTRPVIDRMMPLSQAAQGFTAMIEGEVFGKVVFTL